MPFSSQAQFPPFTDYELFIVTSREGTRVQLAADISASLWGNRPISGFPFHSSSLSALCWRSLAEAYRLRFFQKVL